LTQEKSQPVVLDVESGNYLDQEKKSTCRFARVGYGIFNAVSFREEPTTPLRVKSGFGSLSEAVLILFLIWVVSVI